MSAEATTNAETESVDACPFRQELKKHIYHRSASLSEIEKTFLSSLLIDKPRSIEEDEMLKRKIESANKVLTDDMLFSVPFNESSTENSVEHVKKTVRKQHFPPKATRSNPQLELWKAHQDGVSPAILRAKSSCRNDDKIPPVGKRNSRASIKSTDHGADTSHQNTESDADSLDAQSDHEVGAHNDESSASSWCSSEGGFDHYDTWEVIKDEYAADFGFNVATDNENQILPVNSDDTRGMFKILGTSAQDAAAIPHVLSPPLMESLLNFVPERLANDNFWLKFSLIRDGASLDILKKYCRAARFTILAIETTNGEVFGSFTSAPWRTYNKYFGTGESFLWRMRHNRNTPVFSLFEQAQLESEIDVFPFNGSNSYVQLCTTDKLALGGGTKFSPDAESGDVSLIPDEPVDDIGVYLDWSNYGFGLALDDLLLHGTTSPSATFGNANLVNNGKGGECFDVLNLEVWTFTSAETEQKAERSEMSIFFVQESLRESMTSSSLRSVTNHTGSTFSSDDFDREKFYRRIGEDEDDTDRVGWEYANMMSGNPYSTMRGLGS